MTKELWLNLPVKDPRKSKEFFSKIGFAFREDRENPNMVAMMVGKKPVPVMLFEENQLKAIMQSELPDTSKTSQMIISFDAETREEVDRIAELVKAAGGNLFAPPAEIQGIYYGCAFADLDGHRWNVLYM
ncbi:MAG: extradiol dioxygenase [Owenweeksia sp.]|nr:extradiol dioxygenase [Owenweeksia sp.]MBF98551.1 extradiol dioxygenase [Owenweeksia sp.]HBF18507.1 extradiol dioxygenase [Cryomorphaceae bacterium]HCQ16975.1 extradiol dioxygenase [Cryomorphaceae bacterium]|tara:strand:- start:167 stop:556 length:390 start_codon:yes stop_codon:yes gene_type:complete